MLLWYSNDTGHCFAHQYISIHYVNDDIYQYNPQMLAQLLTELLDDQRIIRGKQFACNQAVFTFSQPQMRGYNTQIQAFTNPVAAQIQQDFDHTHVLKMGICACPCIGGGTGITWYRIAAFIAFQLRNLLLFLDVESIEMY